MTDIVGKLQRLKEVDPQAAQWPPNFDWWPLIREVCGEAIATIERLRSLAGKADVGKSFSEITSNVRHASPPDA
jgi:hypothetical protein